MSMELTENEKEALLKGVDPSSPPMPIEDYKAMLIKVYMDQGNSPKEAENIAEDLVRELRDSRGNIP